MAKTDARVRYTKHVIKESFLRLLAEKPVNRITVKEVCEEAELNRATFYAHYSDCFALLESIEGELVDAFARSLEAAGSFDVRSLIEAIYAMIEENREACRVLVFHGASTSVLGRMIGLAKEKSIRAWKELLKKATDEELEMLYVHLSNGLLNVVVGGYDRYEKEDVVHFVERIVRSSLATFM